MKLFVLRDGHQTGPFTPEQVQDLLLREYFKPSDLSWHEELVSWQALSVVLPDLLAPASRSGFNARGDKGGGARPASGEWLPPLHFDDADLDLSPPLPPGGLRTEIPGGKGGHIRVTGRSATAGLGPLTAPPSTVWSLRLALAGVALYPLLFLGAAFVLPVPPLHGGVVWLGICTVALLALNIAGLILAGLTVYSPHSRTTSALVALFLHTLLLLGMGMLLGVGLLAILAK